MEKLNFLILLIFVRDFSQQRLEPTFSSNFFGNKLGQALCRRIDSDAGTSLAERSRREEYLSAVQQWECRVHTRMNRDSTLLDGHVVGVDEQKYYVIVISVLDSAPCSLQEQLN